MVRSSANSRKKSEESSIREMRKGQRKGSQKKPLLNKVSKRQQELDSPAIDSPLSSKRIQRTRQGKAKLKFSQLRSAFATYANDASPSPVAKAKISTKRKSSNNNQPNSQGSNNGTSEVNCADVSSNQPKFDNCSLSGQCYSNPQISVHCSETTLYCYESDSHNITRSGTHENCFPQSQSSPSQVEALDNIDEFSSVSYPSDDKNCSASYESPEYLNNSSFMTSSQLEPTDGLLEHEETLESTNFQEKCDEYAKTFLNFKNVIKSQRLLNLPDVVVIPTKDNEDQALVGFSENLYLHGSAAIKVMKGVASIHGYVLSSKALEVTFYSPLYDPALVIKTDISKESNTDRSNEQNVIPHMIKDTLSNQAEVEKLKACSTVILLSALKASHKYPKYKNIFDTPPGNVSYKELCNGCFLVGSNCVLIDFPGYHLACKEILPPAEMIKNQPLPKNIVVVTVGSKGAGKSTFNRYLINCLLNYYKLVNYIDCDIGQPEFTISGCISLNHVTSPILGPPFTHLKSPHFSVYYGAVNASHDADRYVESVEAVMHHVKHGYPVVVNTMGWIKDLGMNLLADVIRMLQPSHVVQLSSRREVRAAPLITPDHVDQFDSLKFTTTPPAPDYQHFWIKTDLPTSNLATVNPADRRLLRTLSYFSQVQNDCALRDLHQHDAVLNLERLCSLKPYIVFVKDVLLCVCHETGVLRKHALSVFNCAIVSLSVVSKRLLKDHLSKKYLEAPPASRCYGFGIVRGVDPHKQALYIISNLPQETLLKVNCLSIGSLTIPEVLYNTDKAQSMDVTTVPYTVDDFPFHITGSNRFRSYKIFK